VIGRVAAAIGIGVLFVGLGTLFAMSARHDWREAEAKNDRVIRFYAGRQWTIAAGTISLGLFSPSSCSRASGSRQG
jgi:hypothetical protein